LLLPTQLWHENALYTSCPDHRWERDADSKGSLVLDTGRTALLIPKNGLGEARGHDPVSVLTSSNSLDDRDVGIPNVLFDRPFD